MITLDVPAQHRKPELANFFAACEGCEYDLRFDYLDQIRVCPQCGKTVSLSRDYRAFLRREQQQTLQWVKTVRESIG
jgi:hypothetical protein